MSVSQHRIPVVSESLVGDKSNKTTTNNNTENNTNNNTNNNSKQESIVTSPSQLNSLLNPSKSSTALSRMDQQQKSVPPGSNISDKHLQSSKVHTSEATNVRNGEGVAADDEEEDEEEDEYSGKPNQTHSDSESMKIDGNVGIRSNQKTPRKRSKVSRACDECRRKKVRCNAILDPNTNEIQKICTNCEKSNDKCTFTRVPLKRGPNKGYNKKNINTSSPNRDPRSRSNSNPNPNSIPNPNPKSIKKSGSISGETNKPLSYLPISNEQNPSRQHFILPPLNSIPFRNPVEQNNQRPYPSSHPHPHPHPHPQQHQQQQQQQQQPLSPSPQAELYPTQQQIELRQHPQQHSPQQNAVSSNQQGIFWKVPVEMPSFSPEAINSRRRRGSVESISSLSSSGSNKRLMTGKGSFSSNTKSGFGVEASDSEDEFFSNNLNRLSRSNFQVPFKLQHSRRGSVDTNNESNRSSLSSIGSLNLSQSQLQAQPQSPIMPMSGVVLPPQVNDVRERIFTLLDSYYKTLYPQYPLVPPSMVMKNSIQSIIGGSEFSTVIDILHLSSITEVLEKYIYNVELDISKITKKLTNLIDEQCDDLEITKPNVLISLILVKCYHISTNCEVLVNSLLTLNQMLDLSNNTNSGLNKNTISNNQTPSSTNESTSTRSRSSSINSVNVIRSGSASTQVYSLTDYNHRLLKLRDSIRGNIRRCLAINQTHRHCIEIMSQLERSPKPDINVPRTNSNSEIKYSVVIQSWIRLVNVFLTSEITKEGINGWCYA
ncbi:Glucose transport transcription regulator RGT1 [Pichia kudriavzevii]|uniref:Glucose transport transcription regulator n=1 Tax=Pichia kudriavzevii TaxID=4909 RepID=A0A1V2LUK5_PICKU|nr:Glucose transport transcription regulator RGT1 [Pichia kudriavzevii]QID88578.1 glucose transport transcription regulator [Pichia kudriavzevii]